MPRSVSSPVRWLRRYTIPIAEEGTPTMPILHHPRNDPTATPRSAEWASVSRNRPYAATQRKRRLLPYGRHTAGDERGENKIGMIMVVVVRIERNSHGLAEQF